MPDCPHCRELEEFLKNAQADAKHMIDTNANAALKLVERIHQLEAALKKYGRHLDNECNVYFKQFRGEKADCTCGFDPALHGTPDG